MVGYLGTVPPSLALPQGPPLLTMRSVASQTGPRGAQACDAGFITARYFAQPKSCNDRQTPKIQPPFHYTRPRLSI